MKVNVVMIARDRHKLTAQALGSLYENTQSAAFNCVLVDDGSDEPFGVYPSNPHWQSLRLEKPCGIVGLVRNLGAYLSERYFGRGDYLLFVDNDVYFLPQWLERMTLDLEMERNLAVLGGQRHPYHGVNAKHIGGLVEETDAVAGYAMMMRWDVWDGCGPFDAHAKGLGQSEDWALCQKARSIGMYVGYHNPPTILHTGMTDTDGKPIAGAEQFERVPGVLYL